MNSALIDALKKHLPTQNVKHRAIDRYAFAPDASFFYLVPKVVVQPKTTTHIQAIFEVAHLFNETITFRTAGTSLSGQAVTDGILADLTLDWNAINILDPNATLISTQPAAIGASVNLHLKPYKRKIGPDPASISAAMMGGILSNNSSGMCCGVKHNAYHTLHTIQFILPNGNQYNTAQPTDYQHFETQDKTIAEGIKNLKTRLNANTPLVNRIKQKYKMKNTVGYGINAFLDFEHPLDILAHLLIGAEGTLAFIAQATLKTIVDYPFKKTGILYFQTVKLACDAIIPLKNTQAEALELMDRAALKSIEHQPNAPQFIHSLPQEACAMLCEFQANTELELNQLFDNAQQTINNLTLLSEPHFTTDAKQQAHYWKIRKGMHPSVAAARNKGTTLILEDLTFAIEDLGNAVVDIQNLFKKHNYTSGIIFGHAKDGNLHFVISQNINTPQEVKCYDDFTTELFDLVLKKYDGALKAEHGTGRQVAPFVEDEWGSEAYQIMKDLKKLIDPKNILNRGVLINDDKQTHLKNLKTLPIVEEEVDKCIECGYCENRCPSKNYTLTPRQRIGIRRALERLKQEGDTKTHRQIIKDYQHDALDTCAVDGLCATDCPVDINTGDLVKRLRQENHTPFAQKTALWVSKNFAGIQAFLQFLVGLGFFINKIFGAKAMGLLTKTIRIALPSFPLWNGQIGKPLNIKATQNTPTQNLSNQKTYLYLPTCITAIMGGTNTPETKNIDQLMRSLATKAQIDLRILATGQGVCCGQLFSSKGFVEAYQLTVNQTIESLFWATDGGTRAVVVDVTSCTHSLQTSREHLTADNKKRFDALTFLDSIAFAHDVVLPKIEIKNKKNKIVFHPVCTTYKMDLNAKLQNIGKQCATECLVPPSAGCCGMAGDRGFYFPELIDNATKRAAAQVLKMTNVEGYYSSAKTCEMSMSLATNHNYRSIISLLDEVS